MVLKIEKTIKRQIEDMRRTSSVCSKALCTDRKGCVVLNSF